MQLPSSFLSLTSSPFNMRPAPRSSSSPSKLSSPILLLVLLSLSSLSFVHSAVSMNRLQPSFLFTNRSEVFLARMPSPVSYYPLASPSSLTSSPTSPLIMFNSHIGSGDGTTGNDTYLLDPTATSTVSDQLISGANYDMTGTMILEQASPSAGAGYIPFPAQTGCASSVSDSLYILGGHTPTPFHDYSTNGGVTWVSSASAENWQSRADPVCVVDPKTDSVVLMSGLNQGTQVLENDVWINPGGAAIANASQWTLQTASPAWGARDQAFAAATLDTQLGASIIYIAGGHNQSYTFGQAATAGVPNTYPRNDVWASTTAGATWSLVCAAAPWSARTGARMAISSTGTIVVAEGSTYGSGAGDFYPHDIWASVDGGYTWGQCSSEAQAAYMPRRSFGMAFDATGRLWMAAGECFGTTQADGTAGLSYSKYNDLWVSSMLFDSATDLQNACGLTVSPCGIGARQCWPITGQCACTPSSSSSTAAPVVSSSAAPTSTLPVSPSSSSAQGGATSLFSSSAAGAATSRAASSSGMTGGASTAASTSSTSTSPVPPPSSESSSTAAAIAASTDGPSSSSFPIGAIIGIVIGVVLLACLVVVAVLALRRRKGRQPSQPASPRSGAPSTDSDTSSRSGAPPRPLGEQYAWGTDELKMGSSSVSSDPSAHLSESASANKFQSSSMSHGSDGFGSASVVYVH